MDREVSLFGGAAGRILSGAVSVHSMISGLAVGVVLVVGNFVLIYAKAIVLVMPFTQIVLALALARFVLNGQYGEWEGSFLSGVGGTWATVTLVASRYLLLTGLWLVPMMLFGLSVEQEVMASAMGGGKANVFGALYIVASTLSPPVLLIASVTAADFGELFSAAHWRRLFEGRLVDLLSVYAVYAGGVALVALLCLPVITLAFQPSWKLGLLCFGVCGCFMLGVCLNLLGRLCGFYALGDFTHPMEVDSKPAILPDGGSPPAAETLQRQPATSAPSPAVDREAIQLSDMDPARNTVQVAQPVPVAVPAQNSGEAAAAGAPLETQPSVSTPALPALLDASERIDPILIRFKQDPAGAIRALEDLREAFAPHPQVLVALCVCCHRHGNVEQAVQLAQTVVPICFERGHVQLAAQVFKQLRREVDRLGLNREQILTVGEALAKKGDLAGSGAAYSIAIGRDPGETRAVKGLLQVAGCYLGDRGKPDAALKVYDYLLKHCADSPLAEFMREGREQCRKRLTQPVG